MFTARRCLERRNTRHTACAFSFSHRHCSALDWTGRVFQFLSVAGLITSGSAVQSLTITAPVRYGIPDYDSYVTRGFSSRQSLAAPVVVRLRRAVSSLVVTVVVGLGRAVSSPVVTVVVRLGRAVSSPVVTVVVRRGRAVSSIVVTAVVRPRLLLS